MSDGHVGRFCDYLKILMKKYGIKSITIERLVGCSTQTVVYWRQGEVLPSSKNINFLVKGVLVKICTFEEINKLEEQHEYEEFIKEDLIKDSRRQFIRNLKKIKNIHGVSYIKASEKDPKIKKNITACINDMESFISINTESESFNQEDEQDSYIDDKYLRDVEEENETLDKMDEKDLLIIKLKKKVAELEEKSKSNNG